MAACAPRSPLYRNAYLYKGVHVMPGSQMHKLIEDGKEKAAAELDRQITQNAENLLKRYKEEVFDHPKLPRPPPFFEIFFARYGHRRIVVTFKPDQPFNSVTRREAGHRLDFLHRSWD